MRVEVEGYKARSEEIVQEEEGVEEDAVVLGRREGEERQAHVHWRITLGAEKVHDPGERVDWWEGFGSVMAGGGGSDDALSGDARCSDSLTKEDGEGDESEEREDSYDGYLIKL